MTPPREARTAPCTFCELIHGSAEVSICHEDADAIAFMDIQPVNDGHVLVVPRAHHESLLDVPEELGMHLFKVTMRLANAIRQVTGCNDLNIVVNSGAAAGQDEPHYHVHIIPRRAGDGFDIPLPFNGSKMPDRTVLDANAARIIGALRDPMRLQGADAGAAKQADAGHGTVSPPTRSQSPTNGSGNVSEASLARSERPVTVEVFNEVPAGGRTGLHSSDGQGDGALRADEGAHGELLYVPPVDEDVR